MKNKRFLIIMLILAFLYLTGCKGKDLLVAQKQSKIGAATTLKLKKDSTFIQKSEFLMKIIKTKGTYQISNDTIYFDNEKYLFAIIEKQNHHTQTPYALKIFEYRKEYNDTSWNYYNIFKNNLTIKPIE
jgi:hypothetical protein